MSPSGKRPTARIVEVFSSIQGEGLLLGERQVFLRVAGCNLCCAYCDTVGAQTLPEVQSAYNEKLAATEDTQFLLNIVRLRYRDTPAFLDVASLTTQQTMEGSLGLSVTGPPAVGTGSTGATMSVTPTTTFAPVRGDDFVKRLVAPISLQTVTMVASSGWNIARVLQLTVDRINRVTNAPTATGPTPDLPPNASRFISLIRALRVLQLEEHLSMGLVHQEGGGDSGILVFDGRPRLEPGGHGARAARPAARPGARSDDRGLHPQGARLDARALALGAGRHLLPLAGRGGAARR